MRRTTFVAPLLLAAASIAPVALSSPASAATTTPTKLVNAYSYAAGHPFTETVCIDGTWFATEATENASAATPLTVGDHAITVMGDNGTSCAGTPDFTGTVNIPSATQASIVLWWSPAGGLTATTYGDDPGCVAAGNALVVARNVTTHVTSADFAAPGGYSIAGVGQTGGGSQELATTSFSAGSLTAAGSATELAPIPTFTAADGTRNTIYAYGGDDGADGTFLVQEKIATCEVVTTTTEAPTTTIAATTTTAPPAAPAQPVAAQPTFTG